MIQWKRLQAGEWYVETDDMKHFGIVTATPETKGSPWPRSRRAGMTMERADRYSRARKLAGYDY